MLGLIVLAEPLLRVLFMRGEFDMQDVSRSAMSLWALGSGLLSFMMVKVLAPGYYSRQDTKTPVKFGIIAMVSNMLFNLIFVFPYGYVGLAIATSISGTLNASLLWFGLYKRGVYKRQKNTYSVLLRIVFAGVIMGGSLLIFTPYLTIWIQLPLYLAVLKLIKIIVVAVVVYFTALGLTGVRLSHFKVS
jgi:putative peptidoglycan lipid II flippase